MTEIKLTKRYPNSRTEDITDAYMRGWNDALDAVQNGKFHIADTSQTERSTCDTCHWYNSGIPCGVEPSVCKREVADTPQADSEIPKNALRSACTGCRFVGMPDTKFPCANCLRKNKDYYDSEYTEGSK